MFRHHEQSHGLEVHSEIQHDVVFDLQLEKAKLETALDLWEADVL